MAKVDRVEWIWIADSQTQVNAILKGEIDLIQITPYDLLPLIDKSKDVATQVVDRPAGSSSCASTRWPSRSTTRASVRP